MTGAERSAALVTGHGRGARGAEQRRGGPQGRSRAQATLARAMLPRPQAATAGRGRWVGGGGGRGGGSDRGPSQQAGGGACGKAT